MTKMYTIIRVVYLPEPGALNKYEQDACKDENGTAKVSFKSNDNDADVEDIDEQHVYHDVHIRATV